MCKPRFMTDGEREFRWEEDQNIYEVKRDYYYVTHYLLHSRQLVNKRVHNLLILDNRPLLTDVDAIKKLANILVAGTGLCKHIGAGQTDCFNIISRDLYLVFHVAGFRYCDTFAGLDDAVSFFSQVVADFNLRRLTLLLDDGDVDGKVRIHATHFVNVTFSHTGNHVFNVGSYRSHACQFFLLTSPQINTDAFVAHFDDVQLAMLEAPG